MIIDTAQFDAITDQLAAHERRITAFTNALLAIGEYSGIPVPDPMRPLLRLVHGQGRHTKPRGRLHSVDGGAA